MQIAALYIRVSTDRQEELSPDAQKRLLMEYAEKNGMIVSEQYIFIENGISGKKANKRPKFQQMIGLAKSKDHPIDVILVWKFSRFARNQEESIVYKSLLKKNNIDVVSISEPLIDGPFGSLIERIIEWMDEYYSIRLAGEVTRGMTEKALRGGYQSSPALGYKILHSGEIPVIVPEEAEIVKTIFSKYVKDNKTIFEIARYLNSIGLTTKQNKTFARRSVEYIIQNPMYKGYVRWNRTQNSTNIIRDESEWIIEKGQHEPIVSEELFEKAQVRYGREFTPKKSRPVTEYKHWLSGMVKCGSCGRSLTASSRTDGKGERKTYFQCNGYCKCKCLVSNCIADTKLTPAIISAIETVIESENVEYTVIQKSSVADTSLLELQLIKLDTKELRIKNAYMNGVDTLDEYKHNKEIIRKEKDIIATQIEKIKIDVQKDHKKDMLKRIKKAYNIISNDTVSQLDRNNALKSVVEKIVFTRKDETLDIYFYYS